MYEEYFGLSRPPFKISPDTSLFFEGGKRGDILGALVYAVERGEGIIKVVGEVGSGKTMLCRMLQLKLPKSVEIIYIGNPSISAEDILFVIAHELELHASKDASKHEVMHMLHDYLLQRHIENKQVVLFIEEAQGMPLETLEEIRLLSNLETDEHKLLQIILFGQPELDENLSNKSIRQLRERITHSFNLEPLSHAEIHKYLNFRMREVGYTGPELVTEGMAKKVEKYSHGLLRRINIIADKILLSAFSESTHNLTSRHVIAAVNDSDFGGEAQKKSSAGWWLVLIILMALAFAMYKNQPLWSDALAQFKAWLPVFQENQSLQVDMPANNEKDVTENTDKILDIDQQFSGMDAGLQVSSDEQPGLENTSIGYDPVDLEEELTAQEFQFVDESLASIDVYVADQANVPVDTIMMNESTALEDPVIADEIIADETINALVSEPEEPSTGQDQLKMTDTVAASQHTQQRIDAAQQTTAVAIEAVSTEEVSTEDSAQVAANMVGDYNKWLEFKLKKSREWLSGADKDKVSIQVLVLRKSAARELVDYLQNGWPLNLEETYLYEVNLESQAIYRVFYSEFDSVSRGRREIEGLPRSIKSNSPYLHSVYRMQKVYL
jgi:type II secretory pathway predicted ATPase ExeA